MVRLLTNAEVRALNLKAGQASITDLETDRQYDIFWGGPPIGAGHTDFSPFTPQDTDIMKQITNGWDSNWRPRPVILHLPCQQAGIDGQTDERHNLAAAIHHFPHGSVVGGNPGLPNMSNTRPPTGWEIGGHFCMYYMDSTGGTLGMTAAAHEAFRIALSRGNNIRGENNMNITQRPSPNHTTGRQGHIPDLIVCHITDGNFPGAIDWVTNPASQVSYHFMVSRTGKITQCVNIENMAWGNGTNNNTNQTARLAVVRDRNINANLYSISIGFEGVHAQTQGTLTAKQQTSAVLLMQHMRDEVQRIWGASAQSIFTPFTRENIVGHIDITPLTRPNCPGERFPFDEIIKQVNLPVRQTGNTSTSTTNQQPQNTTAPPTTSPPPTNTTFRVRVGSFATRTEADTVRDRLRASGHGDAWTVQDGSIWQAQAASGSNFDGAKRTADALRTQGFDDVTIV